jgi:2-amino-4-hydroxy-6-hydroxymethyldihydropteridine diphosphokinase
LNHIVYIALGGNMGDRREYLRRALAQLAAGGGVIVSCVSDFYETEPVGGPAGQGDYINAVARLDCTLEPMELLRTMLEIERNLGRTREVRWGPRTIDLDLLLFDDRIIDQPGLQVPHPLMHTRYFVMKPLAQIAPHVIHPVLGRSMADILADLSNPGREK